MNFRLVSYLLGIVCLLIGGSMIFSIPWAFFEDPVEWWGILGLSASMVISLMVGAAFCYWGWENRKNKLLHKEAMAVVGLTWIWATILGGLPFLLSGTCRDALRDDNGAFVLDNDRRIASQNMIPMNIADALFESQSGFSTTGATVLTAIENKQLVPRCILFWRSCTHFLGGLGIIVLFVAILGQGSAGKALMRNEMPGPTKDTGHARTQHAAIKFVFIYFGLNLLLMMLLFVEGMTFFDACCHAFGTLATGGFSTWDTSVGHYQDYPMGAAIDYTLVVFMVLAGSNFALLYVSLLGDPLKLLQDIEWRVYIGVIIGVTALVVIFGIVQGDFKSLEEGCRLGLFQVVSIITTTGFGTNDFNEWNNFARGILFLLMFVGGCAGSTGGGLKVIRHILFLKILGLEIEKAYRPNVVRSLRLGGEPVDQKLRQSVIVYFSFILAIFIFSWVFIVTTEPDYSWTGQQVDVSEKLIDSASAVAATLNNIGPGLGTIGASSNYAHFSWWNKLLFVWLMMLGRIELFAILVLFTPGFWRI